MQFNTNQVVKTTWDGPDCTGNRHDTYISTFQCDSATKTNNWQTVDTPFFSRDLFVVYAGQTQCTNNVNSTMIMTKALNKCATTTNGKYSKYMCQGNSAVHAVEDCNDPNCSNGCTMNMYTLGCEGNATLSALSCSSPPPPTPSNWDNLYYVEMDFNREGCNSIDFQNGRGAQVGVCSGNSISICNCTNYETRQFVDQGCTIGARITTGLVNSTCGPPQYGWMGGSTQNWCGAQIPFDATPYVLQADWNGNNNNNQPGPACNAGGWSYNARLLNQCSGGGGHYEMMSCGAENSIVWTVCDGATGCSGSGCTNSTQPVGCFGEPQSQQFQIKVAPGCPAVRRPLSAAQSGYQAQAIYPANIPCDQVTPTGYAMRQSQRIGECSGGQATVYNGSAFIQQYFADYYCNYPFDYVPNQNNNGCDNCGPQPTGCSFPSNMDGHEVNVSMTSSYLTWAQISNTNDKFFYMAWAVAGCQTAANLVPDTVVNLPVGVCFDFSFAGSPFGIIHCSNSDTIFNIQACDDSACTSCHPFDQLGPYNTTNVCDVGGGGDNGQGGSQLFLCPSQVAAFAATLNPSAVRPSPPPSPPAPGPTLVCYTPATTAFASSTTARPPTSSTGGANNNISAASPLSFGWAVVAVALVASLLF